MIVTDDVRFEKIESKLAWAEDALEALERTVFRQAQALDRMQAVVQHLSTQMAQLQAGGGASAVDPKEDVPPHY